MRHQPVRGKAAQQLLDQVYERVLNKYVKDKQMTITEKKQQYLGELRHNLVWY